MSRAQVGDSYQYERGSRKGRALTRLARVWGHHDGLAEWVKGGCAVGGVLGAGHPCGEEAALLVSELFGNSVRYSASARPGETVTVAVAASGGVVQVEVFDRSGAGVPQVLPAVGNAEGGRGLELVAALAARWGWQRRGPQTVTWFELRA